MKTKLRTLLVANLNPVFFGLTCVLLASLFFTAKVMVDEIGALHDQAADYYAIGNRYLWLAAN